MEKRTEFDSLGELTLPGDAYYGIQTERARQNFDVSPLSIGDFPQFINAIASIKKAAALANESIGILESAKAAAICAAADEVLAGKHSNQFVINVFQGGGYTSANMNMNEVLANRANEILTGRKGYEEVHPNTHVNMGQSTNDVIPAALKLAFYDYFEKLIKSVAMLGTALENKANDFSKIVKLGRTCLQDAVPLTLGQEFEGYRAMIVRRKSQLCELQKKCLVIPLGGTAVGSALGTGSGYIKAVYSRLSDIYGLEIRPDGSFFDGLQNADIYTDISGSIKALAVAVSKISTDLRILSSGPRAGFGELVVPAVQPGSSIMPGKINPVLPELMNQICYQICGNDLAVTMSAEGGELDLNVWDSSIFKCIAESFILLTNGIRLFCEKCVDGIQANADVCARYAGNSTALATVVSTIFGYAKGDEVAKKAAEQGKTVKEICLEDSIFTPDEAEVLLDPMLMTNADDFAARIAEYRKKLSQ